MATKRYKNVFCLFLAWEDDGGVSAWKGGVSEFKKQMEKLMATLECYDFDVEKWLIPSAGSAKALKEKLSQFFSQGDQGKGLTLFILYYGGHATPNEIDAADLVLVPLEHGNPPENQISWRKVVASRLDDMESTDTLILLDCCYASRAHRCLESDINPSTNSIVTIAATTDDSKALTDGKQTFTKNLRKNFQLRLDTGPFTIDQFFGGVETQATKWRQSQDKYKQSCINVPLLLRPSKMRFSPMLIAPLPDEPEEEVPLPVAAVQKKNPSETKKQSIASTTAVQPKPKPKLTRQISFSSDSSSSSDSDGDWDRFIASHAITPEKRAEKLTPPEDSGGGLRSWARSWFSSQSEQTPPPQAIYNQFEPHDSMIDTEAPGLQTWYKNLPSSQPGPIPPPQAIYNQFEPHDSMIDTETPGLQTWYRNWPSSRPESTEHSNNNDDQSSSGDSTLASHDVQEDEVEQSSSTEESDSVDASSPVENSSDPDLGSYLSQWE
ncbi:unnamed protein product [Clonostachys chloroleuca]|uniref:Uncharacterized protein n=1 Tax=Clonostachys chloroleuca TaxID=1926264 RepID=A0AA35LQP4_9HYPO|nr:unnamed protein product [Clonostachys chloroleuca]